VSFRSILLKAWFSQRERAIDRFRRRPVETQARMFRQLLRRGRFTEFGDRYDLRHIRSVERFQSQVETFDYETFKPYIERMMEGVRSVTAPGRVSLFARSSGTTSDRSKYIPVTMESLWWNHTLGTRDVAIQVLKKFKENGALISFDVNYRANLWGEDEARETIKGILPLVDVLFVSEETSRRMFQKTGELQDIMKSYAQEYGVKIVATTQRTVISPRKHNFTSIVYDARSDKFYTEAPYNDIDVIDRIGSGDAYVAGVLFGLLKYGDPEKAMQFGNATSSVKNTVPGDLPSSDFKEIDRIIHEHHSTGPVSEMNR